MPFRQLLQRELNALWHDPWQLALISYIPLLGVFGLWWLFSAGVPRELPVAIVDQDQSQLSRMLVRQIQANSVIKPLHYPDVLQAKASMQRSNTYAMVVLPYQLNHDLLTGHQPTIDIRYNGQYLLVGKLLSSQLQLTLATALQQKALIKQLAAGVPMAQAEININALSSQTSALYNANNNYVVFLLPPVLLALLQIIAMLVFANSLNRELSLGHPQPWWSLGTYRVIAVKIGLYMPLLLLHGAVIFSLLYRYLGLPLAGDSWQLLLGLFVMLLAIWLLVLTIFWLLQDSARVISFCTALFAPAFAFMGVTFPTQEMPILAQWWRLVMPSSHYIDTHIGVVSYDQTSTILVQQLGSYWGFLLLLPLIVFLKSRAQASATAVDNLAHNEER